MASFHRRISLFCKGGVCRCFARQITPRRALLWIGITTLFLTYMVTVRSGLQLTNSFESASPKDIVVYKQALPPDLPVELTLKPEKGAAVKFQDLTRSSLPSSENRISSSPSQSSPAASYDTVQGNVCSYQKVFQLTPTHEVKLDERPFSQYTSKMNCLAKGHMAVFGDRFAKLDNVIVDSSKAGGDRKGGEEINDVSKQTEDKEYLKLTKGFFSIPCKTPPIIKFHQKDHLLKWSKAVSCYNDTALAKRSNRTIPKVKGTTIVIQRYEYANLYCTMTEFYNTFVMMMLTGSSPSHVTNVLLVDAHPKGALDSAWEALYGRAIRAKHLHQPVMFSNVVWSLLSYFSPLWDTRLSSVPYLEEFRSFFLSRHNVTTNHVTDCSKLNAVIIWRRDYVAHPRNPSGVVERKFYNEEAIENQVKKTLGPQSNVTGVQLDKMSMKDQVRLVSTCDLLIAMHGAGLAHVMFLAPTSGFLEIFPAYKPPSFSHFQAIGTWRKLKYLVMKNTDKKNEMPNKRTKIDLDQLNGQVGQLRDKICGVKTSSKT